MPNAPVSTFHPTKDLYANDLKRRAGKRHTRFFAVDGDEKPRRVNERVCPRCHRAMGLDWMGPIVRSQHDETLEICDACGDEENFSDKVLVAVR